MILYYAMGGGLGHLTRARAFLHTLEIETDSAILTSSVFATDKRVIGDIKLILIDKIFENDVCSFQNFLQNIFFETNAGTLYIDSFPLGIIGEFTNFKFPENLEINYIARLLKWKNYSLFLNGKIPYYRNTFILEPLENEHQAFINKFSKNQIDIVLKYPDLALSSKDEIIFRSVLNEKKPFWLIVHSDNETEILELINYADEMREIEKSDINLIVISPQILNSPKPNLFHFNFYPALALFKHAERIFTACGFNAMNQTREFRNKHYSIPFKRRFDDQLARAIYFKNLKKSS